MGKLVDVQASFTVDSLQTAHLLPRSLRRRRLAGQERILNDLEELLLAQAWRPVHYSIPFTTVRRRPHLEEAFDEVGWLGGGDMVAGDGQLLKGHAVLAMLRKKAKDLGSGVQQYNSVNRGTVQQC